MNFQAMVGYRHIRLRMALWGCAVASWILVLPPPARSRIPPPPKREVRAVYIATILGLDWPKSFDTAEQQRSLRDMVNRLSMARFNTIYFQVRGRADAMYRSQFEPWSAQLTGTLGKDPGWDPLAFLLREAHERGMEVHAWFNTILVKNGGPQPERSYPPHVILSHPDWMHQVDGEYWFDPGLPQVRKYIVDVALDVVRHYDIDGFLFDYLRYPQHPYPDDQSYRKFGRKIPRDDWRRNNINAIAKSFHDSVMAIKPFLKIGSAPIGIYQNVNQLRGLQSYSELFQDSRRWIAEGWQDYLSPQIYWPLGHLTRDPDFAAVVRDWTTNAHGRHLYIGVGAYKTDVAPQIPAIIDTSRSLMADGNAFFRYSNLTDPLTVNGRYAARALPPPMKWKDSTPPDSPADVQLRNLGDNMFSLKWKEQAASGRDPVRWYTIYRSNEFPVDVNRPENILAVIPATRTGYIDTVREFALEECSYAVTALNWAGLESQPVGGRVILPALVELAQAYRPVFALRSAEEDPGRDNIFIPYEIPSRRAVQLRILDAKNNEVARLVDGMVDPGRHIAATSTRQLPRGVYASVLTSNELYARAVFTVTK